MSNRMEYLGGHWDQCITLGISDSITNTNALNNGLEYLYQHSHLSEANRWLEELMNSDPRVFHHNLVKVNASIRPVNRVIQQNFTKILTDIELRGEPGGQFLIPDKYLHGAMLKLKKETGITDRSDKALTLNPVNITSPKFTNCIKPGKSNLLSSCSLLWMDIFELALFVTDRDYIRTKQMGVMSDPFGAVLGLILKSCLHKNDTNINKVSRLNRSLILEQWYEAQRTEEEYLHIPFINDFASLARQKFFSADPFAITRIFTLSQVVLHNPIHGESIWKHALNIIDSLPDAQYQLVDFEGLLNSGDTCHQMFSSSMKALQNELTFTKGNDNHG